EGASTTMAQCRWSHTASVHAGTAHVAASPSSVHTQTSAASVAIASPTASSATKTGAATRTTRSSVLGVASPFWRVPPAEAVFELKPVTSVTRPDTPAVDAAVTATDV